MVCSTLLSLTVAMQANEFFPLTVAVQNWEEFFFFALTVADLERKSAIMGNS